VGPRCGFNADEREIAEELNKFFSSVFTREDLQNVPEPEKEEIKVKMQPVRITQQQIHNKIKNSEEMRPRRDKTSPSPGPWRINPGPTGNYFQQGNGNWTVTRGLEDSLRHANPQERHQGQSRKLWTGFPHQRPVQNNGIDCER
jgi:hypothetical protein